MALLDVRDLKIAFYDTTPPTEVVKGISFSLEEGETLGIVGESGSGKTQTALSILHLLKENSAVSGGEILYEDDVPVMVMGKVRNRFTILIEEFCWAFRLFWLNA